MQLLCLYLVPSNILYYVPVSAYKLKSQNTKIQTYSTVEQKKNYFLAFCKAVALGNKKKDMTRMTQMTAPIYRPVSFTAACGGSMFTKKNGATHGRRNKRNPTLPTNRLEEVVNN